MKYKNQSSLIIVNKVLDFITEKNFIFKNKHILICFSGGQDSLCLLILILQFQNQFNYYFNLIFMNHFWSLQNIYKLSHLLKISYSIKKTLFFVVGTTKNFTEKTARIWRYSISYRICTFYNYKIILTAHTSNDQIETLLLNLFRSSSKEGVSSLFTNQLVAIKSSKDIFLSKKDLTD